MTPPLDTASLLGRRVLVTGGTGAIGPVVMQALRERGAAVRLLSRQAPEVADVDVRRGDIADPRTVAAAMLGIEVVLHLAALLHVNNPPASLVAEYGRVNAEGTRVVVDAALRAGVQRLVYLSTIAVYGPSRPGAPALDETAPCRPDSEYGRTKLAGEQHVLEATSPDGRQIGVVLRLAAVYGAGIKGNYRRLVDALARRRYLQVGAGRNRRTLVHEADVARAVILAAAHPDAGGKIFNVTDGSVHTVAEIVAAIREALGATWPVPRVPVLAARTAAHAIELAGRVTGRPPFVSRHMIDKLVEDVAIDGRRLRQVLSFTPAFNLRDGWADTIAGLRERREVDTSRSFPARIRS